MLTKSDDSRLSNALMVGLPRWRHAMCFRRGVTLGWETLTDCFTYHRDKTLALTLASLDIPLITFVSSTIRLVSDTLRCIFSVSARLKPGFHYPSWRPELTGGRQLGPCWRVMETGHPWTQVVESGLKKTFVSYNLRSLVLESIHLNTE